METGNNYTVSIPLDKIKEKWTKAEDKDFWLFHCPGQKHSDVDARPSTKFKGYWLDRKETGNNYTVLIPLDEIKVKWIVRTDQGPYTLQSLQSVMTLNFLP